MIPAAPTTVPRPATVTAARTLLVVSALATAAVPFLARRPGISPIFFLLAAVVLLFARAVGRSARAAFILWLLAGFMIAQELLAWYPFTSAMEDITFMLSSDHGPSVVASWVSLLTLAAAAVLTATRPARAYATAVGQARRDSARRIEHLQD